MNFSSYIGSSVLLSAVLSSTLLIADVSVTEIDGNWTSVVGGTQVTGIGTNEIKWGVTNGQKSGYIFEPAPVVFPVTVSVPFDLGTFTHNNFPIRSQGITQATLTTDFKFLIDGNEVSSSMVYDFLHNETPNTGPGNCCNDIVTAVNNNVFSEVFLIDGIEYQLDIEGFRVDGEVLTSFSTVENQSNSATLVAQINKATVAVPEPSTYLLLSSLLVFAIFLRRRVKRKAE